MRTIWCVWDGDYEDRVPCGIFLLEAEARAYHAATHTRAADITEEWLAESAAEKLADDERCYREACEERVREGKEPWTRKAWYGGDDPRGRTPC